MRSLAKRVCTQAAVVCLWLGPAVALASEGAGGEAGNPWLSLFWKFVNFSILMAILFKFLKKPVRQGLLDRAAGVQTALKEARLAKEAAEAKYREYKEKVSRLEEEVRQIREEFRVEGERQRERIVREAEQAAADLGRQAEAAGANEVKRAKDELRLEVAELSVRLAEELLAKAYTGADQKKAVQQTIENIERVH